MKQTHEMISVGTEPDTQNLIEEKVGKSLEFIGTGVNS